MVLLTIPLLPFPCQGVQREDPLRLWHRYERTNGLLTSMPSSLPGWEASQPRLIWCSLSLLEGVQRKVEIEDIDHLAASRSVEAFGRGQNEG